jgi:hydroxysqualene dehydroxylase
MQERGYHVEIFERMRLLGGRATSFELGGYEVDNGQHVFLHCCSEFVRFVERVGMKHALHEQERFDALVLSRDGSRSRLREAPLPAPLHLLPSFASFAPLGVSGKLRIARALASAAFSKPGTDETFEQWLQRSGQDLETRRAFWDPFFIPALNAPFDKVSAADGLYVLTTAFLRDADAARFGWTKVPLAHVAAAAAQRVSQVHLSRGVGSAVLRRAQDDGAGPNDTWDAWELTLADGSVQVFDGLVLAVPPRAVAKLLGTPERFGVDALDRYDPYPIVDVHLWHDGGSAGFDFAAALDSPLQWIFEKAPGYLCCSISAAGEYLTMPATQLETLAWEEVRTFVPQLRAAQLVRGAATRNAEATYLPRPGVARTKQRTLHPRLAIAGSWTETGWSDTMESAVRSGIAAAAVVTEGLQKSRPMGETTVVA